MHNFIFDLLHFLNHLTSTLCPKSASQCCCKQAPLCRPQIRGHFHVLGASQPMCALVNMASFTVRDGDNGVVRHKCHRPDKWVHETCWMGWPQLMQLIKKKVFSQYSACIIKLPAVVFAVECPTTRSTAPQKGSHWLFWHITHQGPLLDGVWDDSLIALLCASPHTYPR